MSVRRNNKENDLRGRVTKRLIWEALFNLLEEHPFDEISVRDICAAFGGNRSTFYNHFESKYDRLHYGIESIIPQEAGLFDLSYDGGSWAENGPHVALFRYVYNHQNFWNNVMVRRGMNDDVMASLLNGTMTFMQMVRGIGPQDAIFDEVEAQMYLGAVGNLTIWWLKRGCDIPIAKLSEYIDELWRYPRKHPKGSLNIDNA